MSQAISHRRRRKTIEAVITLCCPGGAMGLKRRFENTDVRFIAGMKPLGVFCRRTIVDKENMLEYIDWDRAKRILVFEQ